MKNVAPALALLFLVLASCSTRPSAEACERAVKNIRKLTGQSLTDIGADMKATIRSCRAQSSKKTVECMAEAQTGEELANCGGAIAEELKKALEADKQKEGAAATPEAAEAEGVAAEAAAAAEAAEAAEAAAGSEAEATGTEDGSETATEPVPETAPTAAEATAPKATEPAPTTAETGGE